VRRGVNEREERERRARSVKRDEEGRDKRERARERRVITRLKKPERETGKE
jgi:hypothetical protein